MFPRPISVEYLGEYTLALAFEDGVRAHLDFSPMVNQHGVFADLKNTEIFRRVAIDVEAQTLTWPNGVDLCPDVLYHLATGAELPGNLPSPPACLLKSGRGVARTPY
jgi:hypothetical protein